MPIGKNALKRVENNGYSKVKSEAPDMENSEVKVAEAAVVSEPKKAAQSTPAPKKAPVKKSVSPKAEAKPASKKAPAKTPATKEETPVKKAAAKPAVKKAAPKAKATGKELEAAISVGESLPYYLL